MQVARQQFDPIAGANSDVSHWSCKHLDHVCSTDVSHLVPHQVDHCNPSVCGLISVALVAAICHRSTDHKMVVVQKPNLPWVPDTTSLNKAKLGDIQPRFFGCLSAATARQQEQNRQACALSFHKPIWYLSRISAVISHCWRKIPIALIDTGAEARTPSHRLRGPKGPLFHGDICFTTDLH